jgi:hypothetical protein
MKKIDLGQTVSILANVGVIAGIAFLAFEIRQNTLATQMQTAQSYTNEMNAADYFYLDHPELMEITTKAIDGKTLSRDEAGRIRIYFRNLFRVWQSAFYQYQNASLDDRFLVQMRDMITLILNVDPNGQSYWLDNRDSMDPAFKEFVESIVDESALNE